MIENTELIANPKQRCATRDKRSYRAEEREGASHRGVRRQLVGAVKWNGGRGAEGLGLRICREAADQQQRVEM